MPGRLQLQSTYVTADQHGAYVDIDVRLGFFRVFSRRIDLCEELRANNVSLQCPIAPGYHRVEHTLLLPKDIPPARFGIHLLASAKDAAPLTCLNLIVSFLPFSWLASIWRNIVGVVFL